MSTLSTERIDQLALVWLLVPRKESRASDLAKQLKNVAEAKRIARECIDRLMEEGMVELCVPRTKRRISSLLQLTDAGRRRALETLGVPRLPGPKTKLMWAKKVLLLRNLGTEPTPSAMKTVSRAEVLAARIIARQYKLDRKLEASAAKVLAVLARRALGLEDSPTLKFDDAFAAILLRGNSEIGALRLAECDLPEFASRVADAARSVVTGRWHDAVFISHVWNALRTHGDVGITFKEFQRRLIEAYQSDLIELSRADLVDAMPAADVSASETVHSGARFHFVRVEQLAS